MNTPAQLVIGSYIYKQLSDKEKNKFILYQKYNKFKVLNWFGDNYFYDEEDLLEFWGVNKLEEIDGSVYIQEFDNLTRSDETFWKSLSLDGSQIKIFWC